MAAILNNVLNSVWHAFTALQLKNDVETVHKSKLKVLTANIGTLLDMYGVERGLDHYRSTLELDFRHYQFYLQQEVFSRIPESIGLAEQRQFEGKIEEVCWLICRKLYLKREDAIFVESSVQQLFRIFCLLGDLVPDKDIQGKYKVILPPGDLSEPLVKTFIAHHWS